ncbi:hypothetical protein BE221DRAFT_74886, partial [Ostreococcus tauri]
ASEYTKRANITIRHSPCRSFRREPRSRVAPVPCIDLLASSPRRPRPYLRPSFSRLHPPPPPVTLQLPANQTRLRQVLPTRRLRLELAHLNQNLNHLRVRLYRRRVQRCLTVFRHLVSTRVRIRVQRGEHAFSVPIPSGKYQR